MICVFAKVISQHFYLSSVQSLFFSLTKYPKQVDFSEIVTAVSLEALKKYLHKNPERKSTLKWDATIRSKQSVSSTSSHKFRNQHVSWRLWKTDATWWVFSVLSNTKSFWLNFSVRFITINLRLSETAIATGALRHVTRVACSPAGLLSTNHVSSDACVCVWKVIVEKLENERWKSPLREWADLRLQTPKQS